MNPNTEPIRSWFGFTRRERRSTFTLLLIIILIIGIRYLVPDSSIDIEDISDKTLFSENHTDSAMTTAKSVAANSKFRSLYQKKTYLTGGKKILYEKPQYAVMQSKTASAKLQQKIDINHSDSATLVALPGIGPVLSGRIIKYRHFLGGFAVISQLQEVYGMPPETYELIKNLVFADTALITRVDINSADYKVLSHIRYLEKYEISSILKYHQLKGRITGIADLIDNKLITTEKAAKVAPYLKYK